MTKFSNRSAILPQVEAIPTDRPLVLQHWEDKEDAKPSLLDRIMAPIVIGFSLPFFGGSRVVIYRRPAWLLVPAIAVMTF
jgi:hypothetical protein